MARRAVVTTAAIGPVVTSAVIAVAAICLLARAQAQTELRGQPFGHDHLHHEGKVSVAGLAEIPCVRCHRLDRRGHLAGRPDHATCFGECHGPPPAPRRRGQPYVVASAVVRICETCHAPLAIARAMSGDREPMSVAYPPYLADRDFGLRMSHRGHARATESKSDCLACHGLPAAPRSQPEIARTPAPSKPRAPAPRRSHSRCVGCHAVSAPPAATPPADGPAVPAMSECTACHVAEIGPRSQPFLARGNYSVAATFSHPAHQARGATNCRICHAGVITDDGNQLPAPSMATCSACHDGKQAFSVVAPKCLACHVEPAGRIDRRPHTGKRFEHGQHAPLVADMPCTRCHRLDAHGTPLAPAADHAPCSDAGCHRDDFAAIEPKICGACHIGIEPWRALHFDRAPRPDSEFGARFSHRDHRVVCRADDASCQSKPCQTCHPMQSSQVQARDHRACMGAGCHSLSGAAAPSALSGAAAPSALSGAAAPSQGTAAPAFDACQGCHARGLVARRRAERSTGRWSVRARFRHQPHGQDPRNATTLACTACHAGIANSAAMDDIPTPAKTTCLGCHDGVIAFKVTGHGCARCHAPIRTSQSRRAQ